jgi:NADH:ubiquinone oxidoreductase subunit F (NADH-binding)
VTFLLPDAPLANLDEYLATEVGGLGLLRATELGPAATIDAVGRSGLRGRGGGGFPTGRKWQGIAEQQDAGLRYVVVNGAEGEPGTFKDRALLRANPYQVVEGAMIAAFAVGAVEVFIALKRRFTREIERVTLAVQEMQTAGICRDCSVSVVEGPDDYLYGEEKAMLEVIEGKAALPRVQPPYEVGLFVQTNGLSNPTLVNNVETLSNVPYILARGSEWFRRLGTEASPGTVVCTVVGDVRRAGVGEVPLGTSLAAVIDAVGGGPQPGRTVKAVMSGVSNAVVTGDLLETPLDYEAFRAIGSGIGSCGFIVFDETACMVEVARLFSAFLAAESCGQCPPCKLGSQEMTDRLRHIESGRGGDDDVTEIGRWLLRVTDGNRCYLAVEEQQVVSSILRAFPDEFAAHIEGGRCPRPRAVPLPKILDLVDGRAIYDAEAR